MTPELAVLTAILICLGGAAACLAVSKARDLAGWLAFLAVAASAGFVFYGVTEVLTFGPSAKPEEFWAVPAIGFALRIHVDGLSGLFLLLAGLVAVPASLYSIAYMRHYEGYSVARYYPYFLVFLAAMYGLVSTTDMMWFFFIFWQMMTLPGYALIRFENKNPANLRAARKYLIMMQIACAATMLGAELIAMNNVAQSGLKYDFTTVSATMPGLLQAKPGLAGLAFLLFLIGFGIKMGMWPFGQIWLPDAHPAAPSPVSAMLSGVMIKTGVYGLMRYFLWLLPVNAKLEYPMAYWGLVVAVLGTVTLFTGTMQALKQEQSKRLLAFHSIGQIGYILLGLGICMALLSTSDPRNPAAFAVIGCFGALFHVLNHGLFKALLFLNAGSVLYATGTQDLNKMGGLMKLMPITAITALVGSFSISGVPLFNGFLSKWSIFVGAIQGGVDTKYLPVCGVVAILTSALTLASFMKFFGAIFLNRPSALVKARAPEGKSLEVPWGMRAPQLLLAGGCVLLGVIPFLGFNLVKNVLEKSGEGVGAVLAQAAGSGLDTLSETATFVPLVLLGLIVVLFVFALLLSKAGGAVKRRASPWLCGYAQAKEENRYTAHGFYGEIKRYFKWLGTGKSQPSPVTVDLKKT